MEPQLALVEEMKPWKMCPWGQAYDLVHHFGQALEHIGLAELYYMDGS